MSTPSITIDGVVYVPAASVAPAEIQIVLGLNGWVFVGAVSEERDDFVIANTRSVAPEDAALPALVAGPAVGLEIGTVRIPKANVIARINTTPGAWA
jgi:hypothetical protein